MAVRRGTAPPRALDPVESEDEPLYRAPGSSAAASGYATLAVLFGFLLVAALAVAIAGLVIALQNRNGGAAPPPPPPAPPIGAPLAPLTFEFNMRPI